MSEFMSEELVDPKGFNPEGRFTDEELHEMEVAKLDAEIMSLERVLDERNREIESLKEKVAALEDGTRGLRGANAAAREPRSLDGLTLDDFDKAYNFSDENLRVVESYEYELQLDEHTRLTICGVAGAGTVDWDIDVAGTKMMGQVGPQTGDYFARPEDALAAMVERLQERQAAQSAAKPRQTAPNPDRSKSAATPARTNEAMAASARAQAQAQTSAINVPKAVL